MIVTEEDLQLIQAAKEVISRYYIEGKHHVGAALRTKSGKVHTAVHLEANIGRVAVCAEAIVIGKAISEGDSDFDTIVAVLQPRPHAAESEIKVVSPCGMCRELISDYGNEINVIYANQEGLIKCKVLELLPAKYTRD